MEQPNAWPTPADLVTCMQNLVNEEPDATPDLDDLLDFADQLFPEIPEDDTARVAFHARAERIMGVAKNLMTLWLAQRDGTLETVDLTVWVPALAQEIHGKNWSPNMDTITHLEAQQQAKTLNIAWGRSMPVTDVEKLKSAMRDMYVARKARATKRK